MGWKRFALGLGALGILACLDREYRNPFLAEGDPGFGKEWQRDLDGNGIADSVEFYARDCEGSPAECLRRAQEASLIAKSKVAPADTVTPPDTSKPDSPPKDTVPVTPPAKDTVPDIAPPEDTIPDVIPPKDTIRDTVIIIPPAVAVTGIEASPIYIPMSAPKATPSVHVLPRDAKNQGYSLSSLDETIVKVSGTDLVPVKPGTAKVRARSEEGGFTREFTATVVLEDTNTYETDVTVARMELTAGDSPQAPDISWTPADVDNRGYTLASSDPATVRVVSEGGVEKCLAVAKGMATLTLTTLGKGLKADFQVTVKAAPILTLPVLSISAEDMLLDLGGPNTVPTVEYSPSLLIDKTYSLSSGNPDIVSVSGNALRAEAKGMATITITSVDGPSSTFTATVRVRVASVSAPDITLANGEKAVPEVSILPADADDRTYTLTSADSTVVAIQGGELSARRRGTTEISILTRDGNKTASFTVTVENRSGRDDEDDEEDD